MDDDALNAKATISAILDKQKIKSETTNKGSLSTAAKKPLEEDSTVVGKQINQEQK